MMLRKFVEILLYLSLLIGALAFCWQNVMDYLDKSTGYVSTKESLSLRNLPTLTFCWEVCRNHEQHCWPPLLPEQYYGKDFTVDLKIMTEIGEKAVSLVEDAFVSTLLGLEVHLSQLHLRNKDAPMACTAGYYPKVLKGKQCYKISSKATMNDNVDFRKFEMHIAIKFSRLPVPDMYVMISSEANAYGLAGGQWFDGFVDECYKISTGDLIKVTEVTEYKNLYSTCSMPYYKCLAERLSKYDLGRSGKHTSRDN